MDWSTKHVRSAAAAAVRLDLRHLFLDLGNDVERRGVAGLQYRHQRRALAVDAHDVGLRREAVAHLGDVVNVNHVLPEVLIGRSFSSAVVSGLPFISTSYSYWPIFEVPEGRIRFCVLMALTTSLGAKPFGLQRRGVQVHLHLALLAAVTARGLPRLRCRPVARG